MITEHDLQEAIAECEGQRNPNANTCLKLAAFYIIRDKKFPNKFEPQFYSMKAEEQKMNDEKIENISDNSEFKQAVIGLNYNDVIDVLDEAMGVIKIVSPRLYDGIMRRLTNDF